MGDSNSVNDGMALFQRQLAERDLTTRCLAEVERAMADEPHGNRCRPFGTRLIGGVGVPETDPRCNCDRDHRLALRLARMLAAAVQWDDQGHDHALRAVAAAQEVDHDRPA